MLQSDLQSAAVGSPKCCTLDAAPRARSTSERRRLVGRVGPWVRAVVASLVSTLTIVALCACTTVNTVNDIAHRTSSVLSEERFALQNQAFVYNQALYETAPPWMSTTTGRANRAVWAALASAPGSMPDLRRKARGPVSHVLSTEKRLSVLAALVEGNSVRAVERMTDVHQRTIRKFALLVGEGSQRLHDRLVRDLACSLIEMDEQWSFIRKKEARVTPADGPDAGDCYTWVALDKTSRLTIAFYVGKRDQPAADVFVADLRARLTVMPQITSDGLALYESPIGKAFGLGVDYAQTVKNYRTGASRGPDHRYEPPRDPFITKKTVFGAPDLDRATTAHIERQNLTTRHVNGRMRRLCLAFSKQIEHHRAAAALRYTYGNFCRVVSTLRVTPAMQAGISGRVWSLAEFMETVLAEVPASKPQAQALAHRTPEGTARELPNGRGFLRVISGGKGGARSPMPEAPTPAPVAPAVPATVTPADDRQLDLLSWVCPAKPLPPKGAQLSLFGDEDRKS
jgi:IS1 family transposase